MKVIGSIRKKSVQEGTASKARTLDGHGSYEGVRESGQVTTCLREADPAKAGNAAGDTFGQIQAMIFHHSYL
ncbi:hypothetical protein [Candidatus Nitrospira neomarina]|uniref:Uncharacterized protein n=1 Tax=Candidatus Nitrospira neomarina TaxID=3020899 RepID=A0AA96JZZ0_9BACT|nr:hypothetical protein [Candidatus Nitrospira neomarina]WNM61576.1 hypothetical protein PQG83_17725 [Candidatus Nitrospira neomarina]